MPPGTPAAVYPAYVAILTPIGPGVDSETAIMSASCPDVNHPVLLPRSLRNGIVFSDTFGYAAGLSSALNLFDDLSEDANIGLFDNLEEASNTNMNPKIAVKDMLREKRSIPEIYMACGTKDGLMKANTDFRDFLQENGICVTWDEGDYGHEWDFWDLQIKKVLDWLPLQTGR